MWVVTEHGRKDAAQQRERKKDGERLNRRGGNLNIVELLRPPSRSRTLHNTRHTAAPLAAWPPKPHALIDRSIDRPAGPTCSPIPRFHMCSRPGAAAAPSNDAIQQVDDSTNEIRSSSIAQTAASLLGPLFCSASIDRSRPAPHSSDAAATPWRPRYVGMEVLVDRGRAGVCAGPSLAPNNPPLRPLTLTHSVQQPNPLPTLLINSQKGEEAPPRNFRETVQRRLMRDVIEAAAGACVRGCRVGVGVGVWGSRDGGGAALTTNRLHTHYAAPPTALSRGWMVMVIDDAALRVVSALVGMYDVMEHRVTLIELLSKERQPLPVRFQPMSCMFDTLQPKSK